MKKRYIALIMLICLTLVALSGCFEPADKEFSKAGMTITLTTKFNEHDIVSQTACYISGSIVVTALKEEFSSLGGSNYTLDDYTKAVIKQNKLTATIDKTEGREYYSFTYEKSVSGKDYYYYATTFKASDAFWLIQFACETSKKDSMQETFDKYAASVTFE